MLEKLVLKNVGPAPEMSLEFAPRVNIITGDNGLGKSFILDVAWFGLTRGWLKSINSKMHHGDMARPSNAKNDATMTFYNSQELTYTFSVRSQVWASTAYPNPSEIILQVHPDGEYGVFDPYRTSIGDAFGFSAPEVWDGLIHIAGLKNPEERVVCNGLIRDWSQWLLEKGDSLKQLEKALEVLSPNEQEKLIATKSTRISIDDVRDIPTLRMPYGQEVPVTHASSGIKRIISIAYLLVWTWQEHLRAAELRQLEPSKKMVLLIDELENHLHPQWQRVILQSLLNVVKEIMQDDVEIQIIATTHSPLVMASLEPIFDPEKDAWFDLNLVDGKVELEKMPWSRRGGAEDWLISEAFDLHSTGSVPREQAIEEASKVFNVAKPSKRKFLEADKKLRAVLSDTDEFWIRWRFIGQKKGWL
jgi:predicted ATPase